MEDKEIQSHVERNQENVDGTMHQNALGPKPARKHFFSPLDSTYADAVHRDAETVDFTPEEDVSLHFPVHRHELMCWV